jgi:hypothetical protein
MTNLTNIFNYIPYDVTQWKINPYLTSEDRGNFNAVLEPTERIYRPFPKDFVIKHSLKTFLASQRARSLTVHEAIRECDLAIDIGKQVDKNTLRSIRRYVQFISSLQAKLIYQYKSKAKETALNDLNFFLDENESVARFISPKLKERIKDAISIVYYTDFIRDVTP